MAIGKPRTFQFFDAERLNDEERLLNSEMLMPSFWFGFSFVAFKLALNSRPAAEEDDDIRVTVRWFVVPTKYPIPAPATIRRRIRMIETAVFKLVKPQPWVQGPGTLAEPPRAFGATVAWKTSLIAQYRFCTRRKALSGGTYSMRMPALGPVRFERK